MVEQNFTMKLDYLLDHYLPAYHDSWAEWFREADPSNGTITSNLVKVLMNELYKNGQFNDPIRLEYGENDSGEEYLMVGNGMHRIAAHYFCNINDVKVTNFKENSNKKELEYFTEIECEFYVNDSDFFDEDAFYDDSKDLLSFAYNDVLWIEVMSSSSSRHVGGGGRCITISLYVSDEEYFKVNLHQLHGMVLKRIKTVSWGRDLSFESIAIKNNYF